MSNKEFNRQQRLAFQERRLEFEMMREARIAERFAPKSSSGGSLLGGFVILAIFFMFACFCMSGSSSNTTPQVVERVADPTPAVAVVTPTVVEQITEPAQAPVAVNEPEPTQNVTPSDVPQVPQVDQQIVAPQVSVNVEVSVIPTPVKHHNKVVRGFVKVGKFLAHL
jgi:hypothetical protein